MFYKIFLSISLILLASNLFAQVKVQGTITSMENNNSIPVPFANIALYDTSDTTKIVAGAVSDFNGSYIFDNLQIGRYNLEISCVGFKTFKKTMRVNLPSVGNILSRNYQIEAADKQLTEVVVEASRNTQYVDKTVRTFSQDEIKSSRYSKDLLETLPELTIDVQSGSLKAIKGGSMQILINGVAAGDNELKLLPPNKVLRVEYYDIPPARYAKSGTVINVITKPLDDGYGGGIDISHAVTTGFGNDNAYFKYNKGRNQFTFEYRLNYRDYDNRENTKTYLYILNNEMRKSEYIRKDKFGYTTHRVALKFANQVIDKYIFQIGFKPYSNTYFSDGKSDIFNTVGNANNNLTSKFSSDTKIFSPVVDVYFWRKINETSDISVNVVGTMFRTTVDKDNREYQLPNMNESLKDIMNLENRKQSLIGELAYTNRTKLGNINSGYKINWSSLNSDIKNVFGSFDYNSQYTEQYLYSELTGKKNSWLYRVSIGGMLINNKSYSNEYSRMVFTPQLMLGYVFSGNHSLRILGERTTKLPSVSDLSNNAQLLTPDIVSRGNPLLENAVESNTALMYSANNKYFNINIAAVYSYTDNAINQYFTYNNGDKHISLTKENANYSMYYGAFIFGSIKPFGNNFFTIKGNFQAFKQTVNSNLTGELSHWYMPLYLEGVVKWKDLSVSYSYKLVSQKLSGAYLINDENQSHFMARYRYKNFSFSAGTYWIGMPSEYHTESLQGSMVNYNSDTQIWNNKTMLVFGIGWNFNKGKSYKVKRKLNNQDNDAATF